MRRAPRFFSRRFSKGEPSHDADHQHRSRELRLSESGRVRITVRAVRDRHRARLERMKLRIEIEREGPLGFGIFRERDAIRRIMRNRFAELEARAERKYVTRRIEIFR